MKALKLGAFRITIATKYEALTICMIVIYLIGHERTSSLLFQCIVLIVSVLATF
jgi:hypothetical protein